MESQDQIAGERRVKTMLIEPLERRGLVKPSKLTKDQYAGMVKDLCQRLAYMADLSLMALEEMVAANPGGKDRDQLPIANKILEWAAQIQAPEESASPLMRKVFGHDLGRMALAEGWAPELMTYLREHRLWPTPYAVSRIRDKADDGRRRLIRMDERLAGGFDLSADDVTWRDRRIMQIRKCQDVADMARAGGDA